MQESLSGKIAETEFSVYSEAVPRATFPGNLHEIFNSLVGSTGSSSE